MLKLKCDCLSCTRRVNEEFEKIIRQNRLFSADYEQIILQARRRNEDDGA